MNSNLPLVSVIIPTKNSAKFLGRCLCSIKNQTYKNVEIIVVDNNSTDETKKIARQFTHRVYNCGPERSAQRNFGGKKARGQYFLFVDSDMELSKNVVEECVAKISRDKKLKALIIPEKSVGEGFWAKCKALEKSFYIGVDWMEAARFFGKKVFDEVGSYDEKLTAGEDWDLSQRTGERHGQQAINRINCFIYHNVDRLGLIATCQKKFYYAQQLNQYRSKKSNIAKVNSQKQLNIFLRFKLFLSRPKKILNSPLIGCGLFLMKVLEFFAGGAGFLWAKFKDQNGK